MESVWLPYIWHVIKFKYLPHNIDIDHPEETGTLVNQRLDVQFIISQRNWDNESMVTKFIDMTGLNEYSNISWG